MSKREKIILSLALVVVAFGLIYYLSAPPKNSLPEQEPPSDTTETTRDFSTLAMDKMSQIEHLEKQSDFQALASKIESAWGHDPFVQFIEPELETMVSSPELSLFTYSGYMTIGKVSFAVINGTEYKTGETISEYGHTVMNITSEKVILQKENDQVIVFLKEE